MVATTENEIMQELAKEDDNIISSSNAKHTHDNSESQITNEELPDIELIEQVNRSDKVHELICLDDDDVDVSSSDDEGQSPPIAENVETGGKLNHER